MKNYEHLALFVLGVGTLGITFLLLFAFSDRNTDSIPVVDKQVQVPSAQATPVPQPQPQPPEDSGMEILERQVAETFEKAAAYLGRGTFEEKEHIALLERLEFYGGMSSIKPEHKKAAQDLIKDMGRLLTLKESVARQVKLTGQISAVESDVQIHLAKGERNEAKARKLMDRIESLYSIRGLSANQNIQLRTSLAALKRAYRPKPPEKRTATEKTTATDTSAATDKKTATDTGAASAPASPGHADAPPPAPVAKSKVEPPAEPKPVVKPKPVPEVPVAATVPKKAEKPDPEVITKKYNTVMTLISRYFVARKYDQKKHDKFTADLLEVSKSSDYLSEEHQQRLSQTIAKMKRIDKRYRKK
jgi:hypothetical protein